MLKNISKAKTIRKIPRSFFFFFGEITKNSLSPVPFESLFFFFAINNLQALYSIKIIAQVFSKRRNYNKE